MKSVFILTVLLGLVAAASAGAGNVMASASSASRCFTKKSRCCYRFKKCDIIKRDMIIAQPCSYRKCHPRVCTPKCTRRCTKTVVRVPVKRCRPVYRTVCRKSYHWGRWKRYCHRVRYHKACRITYVYRPRKVCGAKVCTKICGPLRCKKVKSTCKVKKTRSFQKFCPTLKCFVLSRSGKVQKPKPFVSRKPIKTTQTFLGKH